MILGISWTSHIVSSFNSPTEFSNKAYERERKPVERLGLTKSALLLFFWDKIHVKKVKTYEPYSCILLMF